MSEYRINNCNITGDNPHFGDKYIYKTHDGFINTNPDLSEFEKEIVKLIFSNEESEKRRQRLLETLLLIKNGGTVAKENDRSIWKTFISKLKEKGLDKIASKVIQYSIEKAPEWGFILSSSI